MKQAAEEFDRYLDLVYNELDTIYNSFCYKSDTKGEAELQKLLRPLLNRLKVIEKRQLKMLERLERLENANH